jgi:hypothetical protein
MRVPELHRKLRLNVAVYSVMYAGHQVITTSRTWLTSLYDAGASSAASFLVAIRIAMPADASSDSTWTQHHIKHSNFMARQLS